MKRAGSDTDVIEIDGTILGVILAGDYTAEHEFGIAKIRSSFGMKTDLHLSQIVSSRIPSQFSSHETRKTKDRPASLLVTTDNPAYAMRETDRAYDKDITGAWDDGHFAVRGWTEKGMAATRCIADAVAANDLAAWLGGAGSNPFARNGLVLVRASLVPDEMRRTHDDAVDDAVRLKDAAEATGIRQRVDEAGRRMANAGSIRHGAMYMALSPRWRGDAHPESAHPVVFWLNPWDQQNHAYGWFTVEELDEWIQGRGPVIERAKAKAATTAKSRRR